MAGKQRRLSKSQKKYIRKQKAQIKRDVFSVKEREEKLAELYQKFGGVQKEKETNKNQ